MKLLPWVKRAGWLALGFLASGFLARGALAQEGSGPPLALIGATVVGQPKLGPATVLIRDGRIVQVGAQAKVVVPEDCSRLELTGKFLIPGLIDLGSECVDADCLGLNLYFGVTTIRTVGHFEPQLTEGLPVAPRLVPAALLDLASNAPKAAIAIESAEDLDGVLDDLAARGAKWVIAEPAIGPDLLPVLAEKARARGMKLGARLGATGLEAAAALKLESVEHVTSLLSSDLTMTPFAFQKDAVGLYVKYVVPQAAILGLEEKVQGGAFGVYGKARLPVLPGLASIEYPSLRKPPQIQKLPGAMQKEPEHYGNTSVTLRRSFELMMLVTKSFAEAGATIGVGTHSPGLMNVPGYSVHREMELLVEAGLKPAAALDAATQSGAAILGLTDVGKIQAGMAADLLVLGADPTQDIAATQQIELVVVAGQQLDRDSLLQAGASGSGDRLGSPWTVESILGFDEQALDSGGQAHAEIVPTSGANMPKSRFIANDEGYYLRLSGRVQGAEESGMRVSLSEDGQRPWDMASYSGAVLRVRGNKQQFWMRVRTLSVEDGDYFLATFLAEEDWTVIQIPWTTLRQSGRGKQLTFHGRDILGFDIYTRARSQEVFYQLDLDSFALFE